MTSIYPAFLTRPKSLAWVSTERGEDQKCKEKRRETLGGAAVTMWRQRPSMSRPHGRAPRTWKLLEDTVTALHEQRRENAVEGAGR